MNGGEQTSIQGQASISNEEEQKRGATYISNKGRPGLPVASNAGDSLYFDFWPTIGLSWE